MKKLIVILALAALMLTGCAETIPEFETFLPQATLDAQSGLKQWRANDQSMIVTYPHTWFASTSGYAILQLFTPLGDATPEYREYVVFGAMQPQEGDTAQSVADAAWNDMKKMFPDLELEQSKELSLAGYVMQLRVFSGHVNDEMVGPEGDYVWHQYSFMASGLSYSITFSCTREMLEQYGKDFELMLDKLELYL